MQGRCGYEGVGPRSDRLSTSEMGDLCLPILKDGKSRSQEIMKHLTIWLCRQFL